MKRFSNILLVADAGTDHAPALKRAIALAKNNQAALSICAVVDEIPTEIQMTVTDVTPEELIDIAVTEKREHLEKTRVTAEESGVDVKTDVLVGKPFIEVVRQVLRN